MMGDAIAKRHREDTIVLFRKGGLTYREIAKLFNISPGRIGQIHQDAEARQRLEAAPINSPARFFLAERFGPEKYPPI